MNVFYALNEILGRYSSSRLPILSVVDKQTIQLTAGLGYLSGAKMLGAYRMFGHAERHDAISALFTMLSAQLQQPGCQIQWVTEVNPEQSKHDLAELTDVSRETWRRLNVDMQVIEALIKSRESMLGGKAVRENNYMTITTSLQALGDPKQVAIDTRTAADSLKGMASQLSPFTQPLPSKMLTLHQRHSSNVDAIIKAMRAPQVTQIVEAMDSYTLLRDIKRMFLPDSTSPRWSPAIQGDRPYFNVNSKSDDHSRLPSLRDQILSEPMTCYEDGIVRIGSRGGRFFAVAYMYVHPLTWMDADCMVDTMPRNFHWWTSMCLISGADKWRRVVASHKSVAQSFKILSSRNGDISDHASHLLAIAKNENLMGFRMQVCTEARTQEAARHQIYTLISQLQAWGGAQWRQDVDDPDEMMKHCVPGCDRATSYAGTTMAVPVQDGLTSLPFSRPGSVWAQYMTGALLMLTEAKRLYPFKHAAPGVQKFVSDVFIAPMGGGKSVLLQAIRAAYIEAYASSGRLPRMVTLDVGSSSRGIIDLLRAILPKDQKWQVEYKRMGETADCCINPFDTQLCVWRPTTVELVFVSNFLTQALTISGHDAPPPGVSNLVPMIIERLYEYHLTENSPYVKKYQRGLGGDYDAIDVLVERHAWNRDQDLTWKDLTQHLFDMQEYVLAEYAQWRAMPTLPDINNVISSDQEIKDMFGDQLVPGLGISLLKYVSSQVTAWSRKSILSSPTSFKTNARIIALNLEDLLKGGGAAALQFGAMVMLLARHATTRKWWMNQDMLPSLVCTDVVREYHRRTIEREKAMPSRLDIDEYHRTKPFRAVREQFAQDRREIRKFNIHYGMASQSDEDFGADDIELASTIFFLGSPGEQGIVRCRDRFGLPNSAVEALRSKVRGADSEGAHMLLIAETSKGRLVQYLTYPLPPLYLWAFSSSPADVSVRAMVTQHLGYLAGITRLVKMFPGGSIEKRLEDVKALRPDLSEDQAHHYLAEEIIAAEI